MANNNLSPLKQALLRLSDEQLLHLLQNSKALTAAATGQPEARPDTGRWYDHPLTQLDRTALQRLREEKSKLKNGSTHVDRKWVRYADAYRKMTFTPPSSWSSSSVRGMWADLMRFCEDENLPKEIAEPLTPLLVEYIQTGHMRPVILHGSKGCGKTTAVKLLLKTALGLPVQVISVPQQDASHGLLGTCGSYTSADLGGLAKGLVAHNSPLVAFVLDEIDKGSHPTSRASIEEELLSVCDSSVSEIQDKYLESTLTSIQHCPVFMTCNDLQKVNPILTDRCLVLKFPDATKDRAQKITRQYTLNKMNQADALYANMIDLDYTLLEKSVSRLAERNICSLRQYQQVVDEVLSRAFSQAMALPEGKIKADEEMFLAAERRLLKEDNHRKLGF